MYVAWLERTGTVTLTAESASGFLTMNCLDCSAITPKDVFQYVFSFTLDELYNDALLRDESVNTQIYSAGMGAAKLPAALKRLNNEKRGCF